MKYNGVLFYFENIDLAYNSMKIIPYTLRNGWYGQTYLSVHLTFLYKDELL
jgi:hypothetical protein